MSFFSAYWSSDLKDSSASWNARAYEDRAAPARELAVAGPGFIYRAPTGIARGLLPRPTDVYLHVRSDVGGLGHHGWLRRLRFIGPRRLLRIRFIHGRLFARPSWASRLRDRCAGRRHGIAPRRRSGLHLAPDSGACLRYRHPDVHLRRAALHAGPEGPDRRKPGVILAPAGSAGEPRH